jgi:hypothetical protein
MEHPGNQEIPSISVISKLLYKPKFDYLIIILENPA